MCQKQGFRRIYVLLDHCRSVPFEPYVAHIFKANPFLDQIYERSKGGQVSKRDLERMGIVFSAGPRYKMLPYDLEEDFFLHRRERSGPDFFDVIHANYMAEQNAKREAAKATAAEPEMR